MVVKNESFMNNTVYGDPEVIGCVDGDSFFISAFPYGFHRMGRHFMFSIVSKFLNSLILDEKTKDTLSWRPEDVCQTFALLAPSKLRYYK